MDAKIVLLLSLRGRLRAVAFLIFHLVANAAPPLAAGLKPENCAPAVCGGLNITYPFWLDGVQAPECGYPTFNMTCIGNKTSFLILSGHDFYVKDIFYHNQSLRLSAAEFVDDPCQLPYYNLTDLSYPLSYSASNKQLVFFFNCSISPATQTKYELVTCARYGRPAYYGGEYDASSHPPSRDCGAAIVPVLDYSNTSTHANYSVALTDGWLMNWTVKDCTECSSSGGTCGYNSSWASFACFCSDRVHRTSCDTSVVADAKWGSKRKSIGIVVAVLGGISLLCLFLFLYHKHYKTSHGKHVPRVEAFLNEHASLTPKRYTYSQVKKMTKSFRNKLGQGGYGTVYSGTLQDGQLVAVKVLIASKGDGEEFVNEVASISRTSHVNIVTLVGFCIEGSKRALIYDFMPNGSLEKFISYDKEEPKLGPSLDWKKLHQIAVGIARGLEYLHQGCNTRIIHFDIKPNNILLDQDFCPKISDFGLAKLGRPKESKISMTAARGTIGYIAPEVYSRNFGTVSSKSDVYSYGMMVLEMVGAKRRIAEVVDCSSETYFPQCIYDNFDEYCNIDALDLQSDQNNKELVRKMIIVGLWCIQMVSAKRPTMSMVVDMLEGVEDLHMPPRS